MTAPLFLTSRQVLALHRQQIELFGGDAGMRDPGLLESALAQPPMNWVYDLEADFLDLAAAYAFHLTKNHPFNDGNKRVALHAAMTFLLINGVEINVSQEALYEAVISLTTSRWDKSEFAAFFRQHSTSRTLKVI